MSYDQIGYIMQKVPFITIFLCVFGLYGQDAISGYIPMGDSSEWEQEVHLTQIALKDIPNFDKAKLIATATVNENGFFAFKRKLIADKNEIYRLHISRIEKLLKDTLQTDQLFILSNKDSIHFKKGKRPFVNYTNTNKADAEWQRLQKFENSLYRMAFSNEEGVISKGYVGNMKSYTKDSLQILMVKLIGIKQLDNRNLLEKDIAKNPEYYISLWDELKESDLDRSEYLFLENKLAFLTTEIAKKKYQTSKFINILLGGFIAVLLFYIFLLSKKKSNLGTMDLSKREKNIQRLILQGKSNKEIANELFISLSTVKTHITNIYSKLQVTNRKELLQKAQNS